jgi:hypothetical protein
MLTLIVQQLNCHDAHLGTSSEQHMIQDLEADKSLLTWEELQFVGQLLSVDEK